MATVSLSQATSLAKALGATSSQLSGVTSAYSSGGSTATKAPAGTTITNAAGQKINEYGNVVGGAITSDGKITYDGTNAIPGGVTSTGAIAPITPTSLVNVGTPTIPTPSTTPGVTNLSSAVNTALASYAPSSDITKGIDADEKLFREMLDSKEELPSKAETYARLEREQGILQKKQLADSYKNQITAINQNAQADKLSLLNQGRGIPEAILGGQQTEIDRLATIQTLRLAPLLSAAQDDYASAQAHLDKYFGFIMDDATNRVNTKNKVIDAVYGFMSEKQKAQASALKESRNTNFSQYSALVNDIRTTAGSLFKTNPTLAESMMNLTQQADPSNASNFEEQYASMVTQYAALGGKVVGGTDSNNQYKIAQKFVEDNSNATRLQLEQGIRANTSGLNEADIQSLIGGKVFLTKDYISNLFTDDQLKTAAAEAGYRGFWSSWATEKENYLKYLESSVENYRKAGYSDGEILKLMQ